MRFPDVMKSDNTSTADSCDFEAAEKALAEAMDSLMEHRRAEGKKLEEFFSLRINNISSLLDRIPR